MENLTVKELIVLAKGFGLPTTGLKCELVGRINEHLMAFCPTIPVEDNVTAPNSTPASNTRMTIITRLKRRIIDPLRELIITSSNRRVNSDSFSTIQIGDTENAQCTWLSTINRMTVTLALMLGAFGGLHSISQVLAHYFGDPNIILIPRSW